MTATKQDIYDTLKKYWGYDGFRGRQEEAIVDSLNNQDLFFLAPTSLRKKSLPTDTCYPF